MHVFTLFPSVSSDDVNTKITWLREFFTTNGI